MGRPSKYTTELADKICQAISTSNKGLHTLCKDNKLPHPATVMRWLEKKPDFREQYARAREAQADVLADEIIEIADSALIGEKTKETKDGTFTETGDNVERSRLQVDARKWKASKLAPKKYGDKLDVTTDGKELSAPVIMVHAKEE